MTDTLPTRLGKINQAEFEDGFDVPWDSLSDEDRERWIRAAMRIYQIGVQDGLKESP